MAKKQTRKSISIGGDLYKKASRHAEMLEIPLSQVCERGIRLEMLRTSARDGGAIAELFDLLLRKGVVLRSDIAVDPADPEIVPDKLKIAAALEALWLEIEQRKLGYRQVAIELQEMACALRAIPPRTLNQVTQDRARDAAIAALRNGTAMAEVAELLRAAVGDAAVADAVRESPFTREGDSAAPAGVPVVDLGVNPTREQLDAHGFIADSAQYRKVAGVVASAALRMPVIKIERAGGYDPALGRDHPENQDPSLPPADMTVRQGTWNRLWSSTKERHRRRAAADPAKHRRLVGTTGCADDGCPVCHDEDEE